MRATLTPPQTSAPHRQPPGPGARTPIPAQGGPAQRPGSVGTPLAAVPDFPELRAAIEAAERVHASFTPAAVVRRRGPSVVLAGTAGRVPVIAKCLVADGGSEVPAARREAVRARLHREIGAYRTFVRQRPPTRLPRLVAADNVRDVLIVEQLPGMPAASERHPRLAPQHIHVQAVLAACGTVNMWRPRGGSFDAPIDYAERIARFHRLGLLTDRDTGDLQVLLRGLQRTPPQFCHGSPTLNHVLLAPAGPALLDWSQAGWYLPGRDLAVLWSALHADPLARRRISQAAHFHGPAARDAFLVNLLLVATEELRRHDLPDAGEEQRLLIRRLHEDRAVARRAVRTAVGTR